jgi:hypothetical protein
MKKDSKKASLIEAITNTTIGVTINFFINVFILKALGIHESYIFYFEITLIFTIISIIRTYIIRRFFIKVIK